ncbi:MAG TPA: hypothetical protein VGH56_12810, partial [Solirubrobacteraceae bacterium]
MTPVPRRRLRPPAWLRWPRRTARLRFTAVYGGIFLLSGAALVAITYFLFERATAYTQPRLPRIPHAPAIRDLRPQGLANALGQLAKDQFQLSQNLRPLSTTVHVLHPGAFGVTPGLTLDQRQLAQDQHQLKQAVHQLAAAVHQIARAGSVQAAQRAADSHQLLVNSAIALTIDAVLAILAG